MSEENKAQAPVAEAKAPKAKGKKGKRIVQSGQVHIQATFNNTIISVSDKKAKFSPALLLAPTASAVLKRELPTPQVSLRKKLSISPRKTTVFLPSTSTSRASVLVATAPSAPSLALASVSTALPTLPQ